MIKQIRVDAAWMRQPGNPAGCCAVIVKRPGYIVENRNLPAKRIPVFFAGFNALGGQKIRTAADNI
ncbi:MAG: hypothetical protein PVG66_13035 [Chromatiales bacterium]